MDMQQNEQGKNTIAKESVDPADDQETQELDCPEPANEGDNPFNQN